MRTTLGLLLVLFILLILNFTHRIYFNFFTHSLAYGIYMRFEGTPRKGDYAASCLTPKIARYGMDRHYLASGNCSTGAVKVLKVIKGIPGDHFKVEQGSLILNGHAYNIKTKDSSGRALRVFYRQEGILKKGEYFLLSNFAANSWDSRYWGPVGIEFLLKPLLVFEKVKV
ncbi:MAG: S26 family signal peptidase [Candidatus Omnitrophica bacterium]|nr:S26 family signal peptidase [Candidatus Omnitrophota bacterium]MDE2222425.1 S26 family signal peptidase [Candidatus Omnitrophota bacterium]